MLVEPVYLKNFQPKPDAFLDSEPGAPVCPWSMRKKPPQNAPRSPGQVLWSPAFPRAPSTQFTMRRSAWQNLAEALGTANSVGASEYCNCLGLSSFHQPSQVPLARSWQCLGRPADGTPPRRKGPQCVWQRRRPEAS